MWLPLFGHILRTVDELGDSAAEAAASARAAARTRSSNVSSLPEIPEAKEGRELLGELLRLVAALLASGPVHREEFLQVLTRASRTSWAQTVLVSSDNICTVVLS